VNKAEFFRSNVIKEPKSLIKNKFLSTHNEFLIRNEVNFKKNNIGTSYMTASVSRDYPDKNSKKNVISDFKNSKLFQAKIQRGDNALIKGNKHILSRVLKIHEALESNKPGDTIHGRKLQLPTQVGKYTYRSSSVRIPPNSQQKARQNKLSMTAYATGFKPKESKKERRSVLGHSQGHYDTKELKLKEAHKTTSLFYPGGTKLLGSKSSKYAPDKVRPFLDYNFAQLQKPEPEEEKVNSVLVKTCISLA
jgi:hypothetical protein